MLQLVKKLGLTIDTLKHSDLGTDTLYYELYGISKDRGTLGDLTLRILDKYLSNILEKINVYSQN